MVEQWKKDFREDYQRLPELRSLATGAPWALFSATLEAKAMHSLITDLDLAEPRVIKGLFTRPNIFLDVKIFDADGHAELLQPVIADLLENKGAASKTLAYTGKDLAAELTVLVGAAIGQFSARTDGHKRVDFFLASSSAELKIDVRDDFMLANSKTRFLFATNALGMGLNILALYCVMDIDFVRNLADWCQEFGRAGRDGRPARAILCISSMRNKAECLKLFVNAFKQKALPAHGHSASL